MFVRKYPVAAAVSCKITHKKTIETSTQNVNLYPLRLPLHYAGNCCGCLKSLACNDPCFGDCYARDECGVFLCVSCAVPYLRSRATECDALDVNMTHVQVIKCEPPSLNGSACLLAPHSDNGFPRPQVDISCLPVRIWLDCGRPVVLQELCNHNWYYGGFAGRVELHGSSESPLVDYFGAMQALLLFRCRRVGNMPRDLCCMIAKMIYGPPKEALQLLAESDLEKYSDWQSIDIDKHEPFRYFRLTFPKTLEQGKQIRQISIGCIQLVS